MTAPIVVPPAPPGTPSWLTRLVALILPFVGVAIAWVDPTGKISTTTAQAVVILVFLGVGAIIFLVDLIVAALHRYGVSKAAIVTVEQGVVGEARTLVPQLRSVYDIAAPLLTQMPGAAKIEGRMTQAEGAIETLNAKDQAVAASTGVDVKTEALDALADWLGDKQLFTSTGPVTVPHSVKPVTAVG